MIEQDWKTVFESWLDANYSRLCEEYPIKSSLDDTDFNEWCKEKFAEETGYDD